MSDYSLGEFYFIAGMMVLILLISVPATYIFVRQYKREKSAADLAAKAETPKGDEQK
ncbi:MAG: hypothetical protein OEM82_09755 [Acidobacteriota bacterium]|nr:hypothetical protein [Acidobacteriota bacterium]MDH3529722.1 hypothetical protein [Acidobacteriota bacterium]